MGQMRYAANILIEKLRGRDYIGRHNHRWKSNIETYLREMGCEDVN
jgi:hypothetical protein